MKFLIDRLYEKIDISDKGFITFGQFIDFVFEQGLSRAVKQKEIVFVEQSQIQVNALNVFYLENVSMFGMQEKNTYNFYLYKIKDGKKVSLSKNELQFP